MVRILHKSVSPVSSSTYHFPLYFHIHLGFTLSNMDDANNQQRAPQLKYSYFFSSNRTQPKSSTNTCRYNGRRGRVGGNRIQKFNIRHKFKSGQRDYPTAGAPNYRPYGYRGRGRVHDQRGPLPSRDHPMEDPWDVSVQSSPISDDFLTTFQDPQFQMRTLQLEVPLI